MRIFNIHPDVPEITKKNWAKYHKAGWRWEGNAKISLTSQNEVYIQRLQFIHGPINVCIGDPMDDVGPRKSYEFIGVYVRDVEEVVNRLLQEIYEWGVIEP